MDTSVTRRSAVFAFAAAGLGAVVRPFTGRAAPNSPSGSWDWVEGDEHGSIGGLDGTGLGTVSLEAQGDLDVTVGHLRFVAADGNYEFEHGPDTPETHLNSYYKGTPDRTPISVGGNDGQDVVSFIVRGKAGQKQDLTQWQPGGETTLAVDGHGRLRIGRIVLAAEETPAGERLVAILPDGTRRVLAG